MQRRAKVASLIAVAILIVVTGIQLADHFSARKREAKYQAAISSYSHDLPQGVDRSVVKQYLEAHRLRGQHDPQADPHNDIFVLIGEDPAPWFCNHLFVFARLQFDDADKFRSASLKREFGQCL